MAKTRAIVKRRKAIRNIRKITRTMELIATARFKRALDRAVEAEAYTRKIAEVAADLSASAVNVQHPLLEKREQVRDVLLLVIAANRGLCGGYNASILRTAIARYHELQSQGMHVHLELSGKRAITYFRFHRIPPERTYTHFEDKPRFVEVEELANRYIAGYTARKLDQVDVVYMQFLNAARQMPVTETLLPLAAISSPTASGTRPLPDASRIEPRGDGRTAGHPAGGLHPPFAGPVEYEFLPSVRDILEEILPIAFKVRLFKCFLDAAVSEQIARRVAMKAATENADEMIKSLTRLYNRARQAQITKEIAEVIGGAEALK